MQQGLVIFNLVIFSVFVLFYLVDRRKGNQSLKWAFKHFVSLMPLLLIIIIVLMFMEKIISKEMVTQHITAFSGPMAYLVAAFLGAIVHIPLFIAFPLGGQLLQAGVNPGAIAVFVTSLVMVHIFTVPVEIKELGFKFAIVRNGLGLVSAIIIGIIVGVLY